MVIDACISLVRKRNQEDCELEVHLRSLGSITLLFFKKKKVGKGIDQIKSKRNIFLISHGHCAEMPVDGEFSEVQVFKSDDLGSKNTDNRNSGNLLFHITLAVYS